MYKDGQVQGFVTPDWEKYVYTEKAYFRSSLYNTNSHQLCALTSVSRRPEEEASGVFIAQDNVALAIEIFAPRCQLK